MGYQDDYVMRTISDLVRAIARLALETNDIQYELPEAPESDSPVDGLFRRITGMAEAGDINGAENLLYEEIEGRDMSYLEMALAFYLYLNQFSDAELYEANYSREEIVEGINNVSAMFGISGFENFVDTTMV